MHSVARNPADLYRLFAERANAGDLEGLVALYEGGATLVNRVGVHALGAGGIRESLDNLLALVPRLTPTSSKVVTAGGLALLSSRWQMAFGPLDDDAIKLEGTTYEVARRQPDGSWRYAIDDSSALLVPVTHLVSRAENGQ